MRALALLLAFPLHAHNLVLHFVPPPYKPTKTEANAYIDFTAATQVPASNAPQEPNAYLDMTSVTVQVTPTQSMHAMCGKSTVCASACHMTFANPGSFCCFSLLQGAEMQEGPSTPMSPTEEEGPQSEYVEFTDGSRFLVSSYHQACHFSSFVWGFFPFLWF